CAIRTRGHRDARGHAAHRQSRAHFAGTRRVDLLRAAGQHARVDRGKRDRTGVARLVMLRPIFLVLFFVLAAAGEGLADWQQQRSPPTPGAFPPPRPMTATYRCGWSGIPAADVNVSYSWPKNDVIQLDAKG